jgi:hypothetical protein
LTGLSLLNNAAESLEACATYCAGYKYFGTEYGQEVSLSIYLSKKRS